MTHRTEPGVVSASAAVDMRDVLRGVARRKTLIFGMAFVALAIGIGVVRLVEPVYTSTAQVLIQNLETPFDRVQPSENGQRVGDAIEDRVVASQIAVIKSEDLARRVIAALGLENRPEFNPLLGRQGMLAKLKVRLGFAPDPATRTPEQRALAVYFDQLNVFQTPASNVIDIEFTSVNPEIPAAVANTLADTYVMWTREAQSRSTERAREWLSQQIDGLRRKLAQSEEAVERFRSEAGLLKGQTATLGEQEISELNSQITLAKAARLDAQAKADSIRSLLDTRGSADTAAEVLDSPAVQRLKEQRTDATRRMAELSATYLPGHPKMIAVQKELSNIEQQIRAEALKIVASLDGQARIAAVREQSLVASLDALKNQESSANLDDVKLKALEREAAADRALLEAMLVRYAEASARQDLSSQPGLGLVIQNASVPSAPSFPKPGPLVLLITIVGLALGLGLAFLLELMAAAARLGLPLPETTAEAPAAVPPFPAFAAPPRQPAPVPAAVSALQSAAPPTEAAVTAAPPSPRDAPPASLAVWPGVSSLSADGAAFDDGVAATALRAMADWVQDLRRRRQLRSVAIASLGGSPADSAIAALALARTLATSARRTVLVDLSRSGSDIAQLSGAAEGPGIADLITGAAGFTKVIGRDPRSSVHILRYGRDRSPAIHRLLRDRVESVLAALLQTYEFAVVNLGEADEDTPAFLHKCQAALLLAAAPREDEAAAAAATLCDTGLIAARHVVIAEPRPLAFDPVAVPAAMGG